MGSLGRVIGDHPYISMIVVAVVVFVIMLLVAIVTGMASKSAEFFITRLPWGTKVNTRYRGEEGFWPFNHGSECMHNSLANALSHRPNFLGRQENFEYMAESPKLTNLIY